MMVTRTTIAPSKSSATTISPVRAGVRYRLDPPRIIIAPMRIAAGPLQQASLSRRAIWWRGGGDPTFNLLRTQRRVPPQNCAATSPSTGGGFFGMILFAVDVPRPPLLRIDVEMPGKIARVLAHAKTNYIYGAGLCRLGLLGLSAGYQDLRRHDRNRRHELRLLAGNASASTRGGHLDLRFLDGT